MATATQTKTEFRFSYHAQFGQIDAEKGVLRDVSLMTEGEALGHGCWCDTKTLQSVFALAQKSPVKAYLTHGSFFEPDRLGDEVGLFSGLYIDGAQLKAKQFTFFKSFKEGQSQKYMALMELAAADPGLFGVSISFSGRLVWVLKDGSEVSVDDYEDDMPEGVENQMPAVRVTRLYSADFVSDPAANPNGLFDARLQAAAKLLGIPLPSLKSTAPAAVSPSPLEKTEPEKPAPAVDESTFSKPINLSTMIKELRLKFSDPVKFARACELLSENDKTTVADIEAKLSAEAETARVTKLEADFAALQTKLSEKDAEIVALKAAKDAAAKGADPVNLGSGEAAAADGAKLFEEWAKLGGKEATAFWNKHKDAIRAYRIANTK